MSSSGPPRRYVEPGWFTIHVFNFMVKALTGMGLSVWGARTLWGRGRTSGEWRRNPVNLLWYDGEHYLVAPRGVTQWVRNLRAVGSGELHVGRKVQVFDATELDDAAKTEVLRAYLKRWKLEVGVFFDGVNSTSPISELERIAPNHPVFRIAIHQTR